jgi:hypothetical protein
MLRAMIYNLNPMLYSYNDRKHYQDESKLNPIQAANPPSKKKTSTARPP